MKLLRRWWLGMMIVAVAAAVTGCGDTADRLHEVKHDVGRNVDRARAKFERQRKAFQRDLGAWADRTQKNLETLRRQARHQAADSRREMDKKMDELQGRLRDLRARLANIDQDPKWEETRQALEKLQQTLQEEFQRLKQRLNAARKEPAPTGKQNRN